MDLGLFGHQRREGVAKPEGLAGQDVPPPVGLVEHQVDDGQYRVQPVLQETRRRLPKGDAGGLDLALGPDQTLSHRRLRDQKGASDLFGGEPTERP